MSAEQMALFDISKAERIRAEADEWVSDNPQAWEFMKASARESARNGIRFGIGALSEVVRWQMRNVRGDESFKLNNTHRAAFARRLIAEVPECKPYIETRSSVMDI